MNPVTRRQFLLGAACVPALAQSKLPLDEFQPRSMLATAEHPVTRARFPVIDVHTHLIGFPRGRGIAQEQVAQILRWMDELNIETVLNLTGGAGENLRRNIAELQERHKGRILVATEPSYDRIRESGYPAWQADELKRAREAGARGLKILKYLGLGLREQITSGPLVKVDDPRFDPMWEAAGALKLPVFIHTADPDAFFTPIDSFNERWEELAHHPDWSFYGKDFPPKPELLEARNRVIARHPKTQFVCLHVANHPANLAEVASWLDQYRNMSVEIGARLGELGRQPRGSRQFFERFQDRILFGTDATPNGAEVPQQDLKPAMYQCYFRFLETLDEYFDYSPAAVPPQGRWRIYGIGLPEEILK
ncbi:MAG: amidohydrolase family protein, partial [Acidobacteria bacterium]|nr:amidohydrolase family protein [Acidobacteriota bacterium]